MSTKESKHYGISAYIKSPEGEFMLFKPKYVYKDELLARTVVQHFEHLFENFYLPDGLVIKFGIQPMNNLN